MNTNNDKLEIISNFKKIFILFFLYFFNPENIYKAFTILQIKKTIFYLKKFYLLNKLGIFTNGYVINFIV